MSLNSFLCAKRQPERFSGAGNERAIISDHL